MCFSVWYLCTSIFRSSFQFQHLTQLWPQNKSTNTKASAREQLDDLQKVNLRPRVSSRLLFPTCLCRRGCVIRNLINWRMHCNVLPWDGVVAVATAPQELQVNDAKMIISARWNLSTFNTTTTIKWTLMSRLAFHTSETFKQASVKFSLCCTHRCYPSVFTTLTACMGLNWS